MFCTGTSTADPAVDADAPPAIAKDAPAIPKAGATLFRLFRVELFFVRDIRVLPYAVRLDAMRLSTMKPAWSTAHIDLDQSSEFCDASHLHFRVSEGVGVLEDDHEPPNRSKGAVLCWPIK